VLGHASAAMTMDLYGHLVDGNLWLSSPRATMPQRARHTSFK
jgi:hypothetical protein